MASEKLSLNEQQVILQAMTAVVETADVEDFEFQTRIGIGRTELRAMMATWLAPDNHREEANATLAINNCLNEVCQGIQWRPDKWATWFQVPIEDVQKAYAHWAELKGYSRTGTEQ